jgi:serine/threonine protein kinase
LAKLPFEKKKIKNFPLLSIISLMRHRQWKKRIIGGGKFGLVYLVHTPDGQTFVQKEITLHSLNARRQERIRREVAVLSALRNVNIIEYIRSYEENQILYILMQWADKGDLAKFLQINRDTPFSKTDIMRIFIQICFGINYLHDHGFVHRDCKPGNILCMSDGVIKLADFGCAREFTSDELLKSFVGTYSYMAPEVLEPERRYDSKVDIWSLGCILYEMCTF